VIDLALRQQCDFVEADSVHVSGGFLVCGVREAPLIELASRRLERGYHSRTTRESAGINPFVPILPENGAAAEQQMKPRPLVVNLLFPSKRDPNRPLSYATLSGKLRSLLPFIEKRDYVTLPRVA